MYPAARMIIKLDVAEARARNYRTRIAEWVPMFVPESIELPLQATFDRAAHLRPPESFTISFFGCHGLRKTCLCLWFDLPASVS